VPACLARSATGTRHRLHISDSAAPTFHLFLRRKSVLTGHETG
jgi:hypothetical protein